MNLNAGLRYHGGSWPLVMHHQTTGQPRFFNLWKTEVPKACSSTDFLLNRPRIIMIFKKNHDFPPETMVFGGFPPRKGGFHPPVPGGCRKGVKPPPEGVPGGVKVNFYPPWNNFLSKPAWKIDAGAKTRSFRFWPENLEFSDPPPERGVSPPLSGGESGFPPLSGGFRPETGVSGGFLAKNVDFGQESGFSPRFLAKSDIFASKMPFSRGGRNPPG